MEPHQMNIPAAVPVQKVELPKLEAGMLLKCIKTNGPFIEGTEYEIKPYFKDHLTVYADANTPWGELVGDGFDKYHFDLHNPRYPEKVEKDNNGWISVSDRLPEKNNWEYIVYGKGGSGNNVVSTLNYNNGIWHSDILDKDLPNGIITHWMELPQPPTKS